VAVNDPFVMREWARSLGKFGGPGSGGGVRYLADGNGSLTAALGLGMDAHGRGLGRRSKRYAVVVDCGTARAVLVEEDPDELKVTSADNALARLRELAGAARK
jgi:glutaredoxin/glutathione-dependent peroxiredoxin